MADANSGEFTLVVVDVVGTQDYIFASNRLAENLGASYLVKQVTGDWAIDALKASGASHNVDSAKTPAKIDPAKHIEAENGPNAEVLYLTSGSFLVLFRDKEHARKFTTALTKRVHEEAPGLRIVVHHVAFDWNNKSLATVVGDVLRSGVKARRYEEAYVTPLLGLGVTRMCASTALPVVGRVDRGGDKRDASADVMAKTKASDGANRELRAYFDIPGGYGLPNDLDSIGRTKGEDSFIAVAHADATGVGARIREIAQAHKQPSQNRDYLTRLRAFSENLQEASNSALKNTFDALKGAVQGGTLVGDNGNEFDLAWDDANTHIYLPFRPIVYGGDDLTFVCDGRIGLALATHYLRVFAAKTAEHAALAPGFTAGAGVAIVKSRFPFARAYALADDLASEAKKYAREVANGGLPPSALDWHQTISGTSNDLDTIRKREYAVAAGSLTLRPVLLDGNGLRTWTYVADTTKAFQTGDWAEKRNKAKALRDAVRGGPEAVKKFNSIYGQQLPGRDPSGWDGGVCTVFDALELADLHIPLEDAQ